MVELFTLGTLEIKVPPLFKGLRVALYPVPVDGLKSQRAGFKKLDQLRCRRADLFRGGGNVEFVFPNEIQGLSQNRCVVEVLGVDLQFALASP